MHDLMGMITVHFWSRMEEEMGTKRDYDLESSSLPSFVAHHHQHPTVYHHHHFYASYCNNIMGPFKPGTTALWKIRCFACKRPQIRAGHRSHTWGDTPNAASPSLIRYASLLLPLFTSPTFWLRNRKRWNQWSSTISWTMCWARGPDMESLKSTLSKLLV